MTRLEYMTELKAGLCGFDKEVREEIINDYTEHFDEGIALGKSEEEICNELGSVEELVKELKEIGNKKKAFDFSSIDFDKYAEKFAKTLGSIGAAVYRGAGTVAGKADGVVQEASAFAKMVAKGFEESMEAHKEKDCEKNEECASPDEGNNDRA
ncbi:MAG: DUF1700 domain-containing protein [Lachnospiraceae bacterium]|nr:DUF1700 domain-containing protein [Lachnospiraceae bacterium]